MPLYLSNLLACAFAAVSTATTLYPADLAVLEDLYVSTNGSYWEFDSGSVPWNFSSVSDPCTDQWSGIDCSENAAGNLTRISSLSLRHMNLQGTLPATMRNLTELRYLDLTANYLYGFVPDLEGMLDLQHLDLMDNLFTGPVPVESLKGQQSSLLYLSLATNFLTGHIPDLSAFELLWHIDLSDNYLTGTIPMTLDSPALREMSLEWNLLHGPVPDFPSIMSMTSLMIGSNFFSSALPAFISRQQNLSALSIEWNVFEGEIDNLIDPKSQPFLRSVNIAHNPVTGTLPRWLFTPVVGELTAGYNCFQGTLPRNICNATDVSYLDLSCLACHAHCTTRLSASQAYFIVHHHVEGTLPACLFQMEKLSSLIASQNYFTGSLPEEIVLDAVSLDIDLSYNQLTGAFPQGLQRLMRLTHPSYFPVHTIDFSHNKLTAGFTPGDNLTVSAFDLSNNRLSGPSVEGEWVVDSGEHFELLDGNIFSCKSDRSDLHPRDKAYERYDCGSDSVAKPLYALMACATALVVLMSAVVATWKWSNAENAVTTMVHTWVNAVLDESQQKRDLRELRRVMDVFKKLVVVAGCCALAAAIFLAPLFATLTTYYGTHDYEYAWTVSSVLLSGRLPFALCFSAFFLWIALTARQLLHVSPSNARGRPAQRISMARKVRCVVACTIYLAINFAVVGAVNVAFVAVENYATPKYPIAISVFKVGWNLTAAPFLSRYLAFELSAARADWIVLELFVSVMCNIGIPLLAIVVVSPRCLFGLVGSRLSILYSRDTYQSLMWNERRPLHYSYQCSFQFVNSYVATFEYACLLTSFAAPLTAVLIGFLLQRTRPGGCLHNILIGLLPRILRPVATKPAYVPSFSILDSFFDCTQFFVMQFTNLTMICTVGLVFPPLAATAAVAMAIGYCYVLLAVGRLLTNARAAGVGILYAQLIEAHCTRVANPVTMRHAVWLLLGFCGVFYPIFLFDTLGDAVGMYESYWVLVVVPLLPVLAVILLWGLRAEAVKQVFYKDYSVALQLTDLYDLHDEEEVGGDEIEGLGEALRLATRGGSKTDLGRRTAVRAMSKPGPPVDSGDLQDAPPLATRAAGKAKWVSVTAARAKSQPAPPLSVSGLLAAVRAMYNPVPPLDCRDLLAALREMNREAGTTDLESGTTAGENTAPAPAVDGEDLVDTQRVAARAGGMSDAEGGPAVGLESQTAPAADGIVLVEAVRVATRMSDKESGVSVGVEPESELPVDDGGSV